MNREEIPRKDLDNEEFVPLRQASEKMAHYLSKRLEGHLEVLKPLFIPRKLLGSFIKSATAEEVPRSDRAFAELQKKYIEVCEKPFGLPRKLDPPIPTILTQLAGTPYQYSLTLEGSKDRAVRITSPTRWVLSYRGECPLNRLRAMVAGTEPAQRDEMKQGLIEHILPVVFLKYHPELLKLFEDLRYYVEIRELAELGNLPVVVVKAPVRTFLPPDDFILQITRLSGIAAFQEIIDQEGVKKLPDSLKDTLRDLISQS